MTLRRWRDTRGQEALWMLKGLDPMLSPELLAALRAMGHGDELALVEHGAADADR